MIRPGYLPGPSFALMGEYWEIYLCQALLALFKMGFLRFTTFTKYSQMISWQDKISRNRRLKMHRGQKGTYIAHSEYQHQLDNTGHWKYCSISESRLVVSPLFLSYESEFSREFY